MKRFVEGDDRLQGALLPHCLDDADGTAARAYTSVGRASEIH
jgi:hypothetical protein